MKRAKNKRFFAAALLPSLLLFQFAHSRTLLVRQVKPDSTQMKRTGWRVAIFSEAMREPLPALALLSWDTRDNIFHTRIFKLFAPKSVDKFKSACYIDDVNPRCWHVFHIPVG